MEFVIVHSPWHDNRVRTREVEGDAETILPQVLSVDVAPPSFSAQYENSWRANLPNDPTDAPNSQII